MRRPSKIALVFNPEAMASTKLATPLAPSSSIQSTFTILYFANAYSYTGTQSERLPAPLPLQKLYPKLESRYPGITAKVLNICAVTVNLEYVDIDTKDNGCSAEHELVIQPGDEVGIIPPVSSG